MSTPGISVFTSPVVDKSTLGLGNVINEPQLSRWENLADVGNRIAALKNIGAGRSYDSVVQMLSLEAPKSGEVVLLKGYYAPGDGGGGTFHYVPGDETTPVDNGTVFAPSAGGRLKREYSGQVNVRWFGARADGVTDDKAPIQAALDAVSAAGGGEVFVPPGVYAIATGPVDVRSNTVFRLHGTLKNPNGVNRMVLRAGDVSQMVFVGNKPAPVAANISIFGDGKGVIDQNGQNSQNWDHTNPNATSTSHALYARSVDGLVIEGITVQNCNMWAIATEFCVDVRVSNNWVLSGRRSNGYSGGTWYPLSTQDGIHLLDSSDCLVEGNSVESSDDCVAVTANYTLAENIRVTGNRLRHIALLAEAPEIAMARFCMSAVISGSSATYAGQAASVGQVKNVLFSKNQCSGGSGWFYVGNDLAEGGSNTNRVSGVTIADNEFVGFTDVGPAPYYLIYGALLEHCEHLAVRNNFFYNNNRMAQHSKDVSHVTWEGNRGGNFGELPFSGFTGNRYAVLYFYNDYPAGPCSNIVVARNQFTNLAHAFVYAGAVVGDPDMGGDIDVSENTLVDVATANTSASYGQAIINIHNHSRPRVRQNRIVRARAGGIGVHVAASDLVEVTGNVLLDIGYNNSMTDAHGIFVQGKSRQLLHSQVSNNVLNGVDSYGMYLVNPGALSVAGNGVQNPGRQSAGLSVGVVVYATSSTGSADVYGLVAQNTVSDAAVGFYLGNTGISAWSGSPVVLDSGNQVLRCPQKASLVNPEGLTLYQHGPKTLHADLTIIDPSSNTGSLVVVGPPTGSKWLSLCRSNDNNYSGFYDEAGNVSLLCRNAAGDKALQMTPGGESVIPDQAKFDADATAGNTRMLLWDVDAGTLKRVSVGAADSGGTGFKVLRVAN